MASFPSSYIPTGAAAATRAADVLTYTAGVTYPIQLWSEFERAVDTGGNEVLIAVDIDTNNRGRLAVGSSDQIAGFTSNGGVVQINNVTGSAITVGSVAKGALRVATNDGKIASNGTLGATLSPVTNPAGSNPILRIGFDIGGNPSWGYIRRIAIIQGAGTDANLIAMTT